MTIPSSPSVTPGEHDVHLVERGDGWHLTLRLTEQLRDELADRLDAGLDGADIDVTVVVEPNLLPGEPFAARLRLEAADSAEKRPRPPG